MKFIRKIHLWLSVPVGVVIALVCLSGAALLFETEITHALRRDVYEVAEVRQQPLPMAQIVEAVEATLPDSVAVTGVTVSADPRSTYRVGITGGRMASVYVDQYTGAVTGRYERLPFFTTMSNLHRRMLMGSGAGKTIVGISTLIFVVALVTGIFLWWPRARHSFLHSMSIPVGHGAPGFLNGLHVAGGMYALVFVLAMALTGLTWSFGWYRTAFYALCGASADKPSSRDAKPAAEAEAEAPAEYSRWQEVYDRLAADNPSADKITVGPGTASVALSAAGNSRAADKYEFDPATGQITSVAPYADTPRADSLRGWIRAIHTGSFGGLLTRILWLIAALIGATLPLTGYYLWTRRLGRHHDHHHHH